MIENILFSFCEYDNIKRIELSFMKNENLKKCLKIFKNLNIEFEEIEDNRNIFYLLKKDNCEFALYLR